MRLSTFMGLIYGQMSDDALVTLLRQEDPMTDVWERTHRLRLRREILERKYPRRR